MSAAWRAKPIAVLVTVTALACASGLAAAISKAEAGEAARPPSRLNIGIPADAGVVFWLSWKDNATNETSYDVERSSDDSSGPWTVVAALPPDTERFDDRGIELRRTYWYRVAAVGPNGSKAYSLVASAYADPRALVYFPLSQATATLEPPELPGTGAGPAESSHRNALLLAAAGAVLAALALYAAMLLDPKD